MSSNLRNKNEALERVARRVRISSEPQLPQIHTNAFARSFYDEVPTVLHKEASDSDEHYERSGNLHSYTQNADGNTITPEEPFLNQIHQPESKVMVDEKAVHIRDASSAVPLPLRPHRRTKLFGLALELFICLLPMSFLILAILAKRLEGREISHYGKNIKEWTTLAPTIFPLVFAAVAGQGLRSVARYKLERGCKLKASGLNGQRDLE